MQWPAKISKQSKAELRYAIKCRPLPEQAATSRKPASVVSGLTLHKLQFSHIITDFITDTFYCPPLPPAPSPSVYVLTRFDCIGKHVPNLVNAGP